jgi:hypothetical protein
MACISILRRSALALSTTLCWFSLAATAHAQDRAPAAGDPDALGTHQRHLRLDLGLRTQFVSDAGLDPFSENDLVPHLSLGASYAFWARDALSIAGVFGFDYATWSASARSNETSLDLRRFALGPEARYHVLRILVVSAKVAPTLTRQSASLSTGLATDLTKVAWKGGVDATAGVAVEVFGFRSGLSRSPRLWVTGEGGYGWTASNHLVLKPDEAEDAPQRPRPVDLGELSLSGPLLKIGAALSFW